MVLLEISTTEKLYSVKTVRSQSIDREEKHISLEIVFMVVFEVAFVTAWI